MCDYSLAALQLVVPVLRSVIVHEPFQMFQFPTNESKMSYCLLYPHFYLFFYESYRGWIFHVFFCFFFSLQCV